jgi:hypothetical protein
MYNKTKKEIIILHSNIIKSIEDYRHSDYSSNGEYFRYFSNLSAESFNIGSLVI